MKRCAKVLYVLVDEFSDLIGLSKVLNLRDSYQLQLMLLDVSSEVVEDTSTLLSCVLTSDLRDRRQARRLEQLEALASMTGIAPRALRRRAAFGNRHKEIVYEAARGDYHLVIKRSENKSMDRYLSKHCPCPVWLLTPEDYAESGELDVYNASAMVASAAGFEPSDDASLELANFKDHRF